ncbi:MAG: ankyrin repeat domain-containing protein [Bacteroidales bacterium]
MLQKPQFSILFLLLAICVLPSCKDGGKNQADESQNHENEVKVPLRAPGQQTPPAATAREEQLFREACMQGLAAEVEGYLDSGVDPAATDGDGRTGLMLAAFNGHTDIVKLLLDMDVPVNKTDQSGRTALMYASTGHFPETVETLLTGGADPNMADNQEGFTALMFAAAEGNARVVRLLLDHGANPDTKDIDGDDAETFARQNGHTEVAEMVAR